MKYREITPEDADALWELDVRIQFKAPGTFDWCDFPYRGIWSPSRDRDDAIEQRHVKDILFRTQVEG